MSKARKLYERLDELPRLFIVSQFLGLFLGIITGSFAIWAVSFGTLFVLGFFVHVTKVGYGCAEALHDQPPGYFLVD